MRIAPRGHASELDSVFDNEVEFGGGEVLRLRLAQVEPWDKDSDQLGSPATVHSMTNGALVQEEFPALPLDI